MPPRRLQRQRTLGWRASQVSKNQNGYAMITRETVYGNPYVVTISAQPINGKEPIRPPEFYAALRREEKRLAVELFNDYAVDYLKVNPTWLEPLRGKDLFCSCPVDQPCHGDVLLQLANDVI